jgi:hypothetical protein
MLALRLPGLHQSLVEGIVQRNDFLGWTREQIADWIVASELDCEAMLDCSPEREGGIKQRVSRWTGTGYEALASDERLTYREGPYPSRMRSVHRRRRCLKRSGFRRGAPDSSYKVVPGIGLLLAVPRTPGR